MKEANPLNTDEAIVRGRSKKAIVAGATAIAAVIAGGTIAYNHNSSRPESGSHEISSLTKVLDGLEAGKSATVTAKKVSIPGPINEASGQPIVFKADGKTYFAYSQEHQPNFKEKPEALASTMAIVSADSEEVPVIEANVSKSGELVTGLGGLEIPVGFSTGGDNTDK